MSFLYSFSRPEAPHAHRGRTLRPPRENACRLPRDTQTKSTLRFPGRRSPEPQRLSPCPISRVCLLLRRSVATETWAPPGKRPPPARRLRSEADKWHLWLDPPLACPRGSQESCRFPGRPELVCNSSQGPLDSLREGEPWPPFFHSFPAFWSQTLSPGGMEEQRVRCICWMSRCRT